MAFHAITAGEGDQYIAAGIEAVSRAGLGAAPDPNSAHPLLDGSEGSLYNVYIPMGLTAENVAERCGVTREQQDEWAVVSQSRAVAARESGHFAREIVPVTVPAHADTDREGNDIDVPESVLSKDDGPRPGTTMEVLAKLKPAFKEDGTVTAGNSCPLNAGAAGARAAGAHHRLLGVGAAAGDHGPRADLRHSRRARPGRYERLGYRHLRDQRGLRGADRALHG